MSSNEDLLYDAAVNRIRDIAYNEEARGRKMQPPPYQCPYTFEDIRNQYERHQCRALSTEDKHGLLAFDPAALIAGGVIHLPDDVCANQDRGSSLNFKLTLFRKENWEENCRDVYETLEPGLRLASMWLVHKAFSAFWNTTCFGTRERETDSDGNPKLEESWKCVHIPQRVKCRRIDSMTFTRLLEKMDSYVRFLFHHEVAETDGDIQATGLNIRPGRGHKRSLIVLCTDLYRTAQKIQRLTYRNSDEVLRFNFMLAVVLTHEMAHQIERIYLRAGETEARHANEDIYEAGFTWERSLFGSRVLGIDDTIDGARGICVEEDTIDIRDESRLVRKYRALPME